MGGVLSAGSVAYYRNEGRTVDDVSRALFRASIMGGATLFCVNALSAWSCSNGAIGLLEREVLPVERVLNEQGADCLRGYCYYDNMCWALAAFLTAAVGATAATLRSRPLGIAFMILFVARGVSCIGALVVALSDTNSCAAWALSKTYWLPVITLASVASYGGLSWKFARVLRVLGGQSSSADMVDMSALEDIGNNFDRLGDFDENKGVRKEH